MKTLLKSFIAGIFALGMAGGASAQQHDLKMATIAPGSSAVSAVPTGAIARRPISC